MPYRNKKNSLFRILKAVPPFLLLTILSLPGTLLSFNVPDSHNNLEGWQGMVFVPVGSFIMGVNDDELEGIIRDFGHRGDFEGYDFEAEKPRRSVYLNSYYIDKHEVTNGQYDRFVKETGYNPPRHWRDGTVSPDKTRNPVLYVNWYDAAAYCYWQGKRLPTDEEWEKAARGNDGRRYPWGNEYDPDKTVTAEYVLKHYRTPAELTNFAAPIDELRGDKSPYGVYDMAGNVMEWTSSDYQSGQMKTVKGAAWVHLHARARNTAKEGVLPKYSSQFIGFRCAMDSDTDLRLVRITAGGGTGRS